METVTNISMLLNKCGLQSMEGISWFWGPQFCGSLAPDDVFVTDLDGICVLSRTHWHQQERVLCVQRNQSFKELIFCLGTMCSFYLSVCPSSPSECREGQMCSPREPGRPRQCRGSGMSSSNQAPGVILAYNQNQSINLRGSLCVISKENQSLYSRLPS